MTTMTAGKLWGMRRLADAQGYWKMLANDQRTPLVLPIAAKRGTETADFEDVARVKVLIAKHLAPHASAQLLDPVFAYPAAAEVSPPQAGLMMCLEHTITEQTPGGRITSNIPDWSVPKIRRMGADAVKILVWYRAEASEEVRRKQQDYVRAVGRICRELDIVHLLELLVYPLPGETPEAFAAGKTQFVLNSVQDFLDPEFAVDIYKLEPVTDLAGVPDPDGPEATAVQAAYDKMVAGLPRPWVLLSAGGTAENFRRSLVYAYRAGASGYLCGRAVWSTAFDRFPDWAAMETVLQQESLPFLQEINELTDRMATPWHRHASWGGAAPQVEGAGPGFAAGYRGLPA